MYGALDPALWDSLTNKAWDEPVALCVWGVIQSPPQNDKATRLTDASSVEDLYRRQAERARAVADAHCEASFEVAELLGIEQTYAVAPSGPICRPYVCADVAAGDALALSRDSRVLRITEAPKPGKIGLDGLPAVIRGNLNWWNSSYISAIRARWGLNGQTNAGARLAVGVLDMGFPDYMFRINGSTGSRDKMSWRMDKPPRDDVLDLVRDSEPPWDFHAYKMLSLLLSPDTIGFGVMTEGEGVYAAVHGWLPSTGFGERSALEFLVDQLGYGGTLSRSLHLDGDGDRTCTGAVPQAALEREWYAALDDYRTLMVFSAGNDGLATGICAAFGENVFIVGGSDDQGTDSRLDDTIYVDSSSRNPTYTGFSSLELPRIVAPATEVATGLYPDGESFSVSGTSIAAPMVAGVDVLMKERATDSNVLWGIIFAGFPEVRKAILMVTANRNVDGVQLNLLDTTDDRDGAGQLNACAAALISDSQHSRKLDGTDSFTEAGAAAAYLDTSTCSPWCPEYGKVRIAAGSTVVAALDWLVDPACVYSGNDYVCQNIVPQNFQLYLKCGTVYKRSSTASTSPYEYLRWTNDTGATVDCELKIYYSGSTPNLTIPAGMAFISDSYITNNTCGMFD